MLVVITGNVQNEDLLQERVGDSKAVSSADVLMVPSLLPIYWKCLFSVILAIHLLLCIAPKKNCCAGVVSKKRGVMVTPCSFNVYHLLSAASETTVDIEE